MKKQFRRLRLKKSLQAAVAVVLVFSAGAASAAPAITNFYWTRNDGTLVATWNTDVPAYSKLESYSVYSSSWSPTAETTVMATYHSITNYLGEYYPYKIRPVSRDGNGSTTGGKPAGGNDYQSEFILPTLESVNVTFDGYDVTKAMITYSTCPWQGATTPAGSTVGWVEYGMTTSYGTTTATATAPGHAFRMTGLTPGGTLYYKAHYRYIQDNVYAGESACTGQATVPASNVTIGPSQVIVLENTNDPESVALGAYYVAKRGIPAGNVCELNVPLNVLYYGDMASISRTDYNTYIRDPLRTWLNSNPSIRDSARFIAVTRRLPYVLEGEALDEHLCDPFEQAYTGLNPYDQSGPLQYRPNSNKPDGTHQYYLVTHIDGSTLENAKRMIDVSLYAEKYVGPSFGKAWWDSRGDLPPSGYYDPSRAYRTCARISAEMGWTTTLDDNGETISHPPAPAFADNAFLYAGWYTWPYEDAFDWKPGAVAWHLQSATASGARSDTVTGGYWCSGLLNRGVAATLGAVSEPYVQGYNVGDDFYRAFCQGYTFGESCFLSYTWQGWMMAFFGDPLYRLPQIPQVDNTPPAISNVAPTGVSGYADAQEIIAWETDDPCYGVVEWGATASYGNTVTLDDRSHHTTTWYTCRHQKTITGLTAGTTYHFRIRSTDPAGNLTVSGDQTFTTAGGIPAAAPAGLAASATDGQVTLTWNTNTETDVLGYKIYRSTTSGVYGASLAMVGNVASYTDTGVNNGTTYYYEIRAYDANADGNMSAEASATPASLSAPSNVGAVGGNGLVNLSWDPVMSPLVSGYRIHRGTSPGAPNTAITINGNVTYYRDASVANGTPYFYTISTIASVEGTNSIEVSATPTFGGGTPDLIATVIFQQGVTPGPNYRGVKGTGTGINSWVCTWSSGSGYDDTYDVGYADTARREWLLWFDPGMNDTWGQVVEATLSLHVTSASTTPDAIAVRQVTDPDNLGSSYQTGWAVVEGGYANVSGGATKAYRDQVKALKWRNADTTNNVNNLESACAVAEPGGTNSITTSGWFDFNVSGAMESFRAGTAPNQGWLISNTGSPPYYVEWVFATEKHSTMALRPKLKVKYRVLSPAKPDVTDIMVTNVSATSASITWKTDKPSRSQVEYGLTSSYGSSTAVDGNLILGHAMTITGLTPATQYHFRIKADDGGGNVGYSGDNVLRTSPASQASTLLMRDKVGGYWSGAIFELWTMSTNGTRTQLTQTGVGYKDFQWSADGTKIVCAAPDCVVMMNADGSSVRTVITVPDVYNNRGNYIIFSPSLTPDQQWIYCVYESGDFCGIYKVKSDGAQLTRLSKYNDYTLEGLRVSPDGAKLLYVSGKTGHKQIYLANLDLTGEVNLSNSSGDDLTPAFSPDMTGIVFASSRDGNWEVYKMNLDGNTVVRLTNTSNGTESNPVWGNDGRIYFNKSTYENWGSLWATLNLVYAMNADGSNVIRISNPADYHKNTSDGSDDMYEEKCELAVPALPLAGSFAIEGVTAPGPGRAMSMSWAGATGRLYSVLFTRDLVTGAWSNVPDSGYLNMPGQNGPMSYTNTADLGSNAFFRVRSSW